jgi:hypothetical protein
MKQMLSVETTADRRQVFVGELRSGLKTATVEVRPRANLSLWLSFRL